MKWFVGIIALASALLAPSIGRSAAAVAIQWAGVTNLPSPQQDPHGAAGPQGIFALANDGVAYFSKTGQQLWQTNKLAFHPASCCDAKALFDPVSQRFFVIDQLDNATNFYAFVSRNSNPLSGGTNDWIRYLFSTGTNAIDYPGIGMDAQAIYAGYAGGGSWIVVNKAQLLSGLTNSTTLQVVKTPPTYGGQGLQPTWVVGSQSPGDVAYSVAFSSQNQIQLNAITNVLGAPAFFTTNLPAPDLGNIFSALGAPQLGTTVRLNTGVGAPAMGNAFWRNGELWFCGGAVSSNQPERTVVRYYKINTGGFPNGQASLAEWGDLDGGTNTWRQHPSIGGNARGDVCLVFTQTSSNTVPAIYAAIRKAGDTSFQTLLVKTSAAPWTASSDWTDYSVVTPDPEDQTFWVSHVTVTTASTTATWWANITRDSLLYVDKNAVGSEVGTRALPFHTVRNAQTAASGAMTLVIRSNNYPETPLPLLINKNVRLENPYPSGIVHIGP